MRSPRTVEAVLTLLARRYLLAEIAGTALMLAAGLLATRNGHDGVVTVVVVALIAEGIGFYGVIGFGVWREQWRSTAGHDDRLRRTAVRTAGLIGVEFGPAELVDAVTRPPIVALGVVALGPGWVGLLAGKVVADVVFYVLAFGAYLVTRVRGWRRPSGPVKDALLERRTAEVRDLIARPDVADALRAHGTPLMVLEPETVRRQYRRLSDHLPYVRFHYAVKALAHPAVVSAIDAEDGWFDVASAGELRLLQQMGIEPDRIIHTHPVKSEREIADAVAAGVSTFVVDSADELRKLKAAEAGVRVLIRLAYRNARARVDLSSKFGVDHAEAERLVRLALTMGVPVAGFSFHVGSQLDAVAPFPVAVERTLELMDRMEQDYGLRFSVLDIGGGFPVDYRSETVTIGQIAAALDPLLAPRASRLEILSEPGRVVVADAMTLIAGVVGVAERGGRRWVHLDDGVYGSWSNHVFEGIEPMLLTSPDLAGQERPRRRTTLAGPTCDSIDVLARDLEMPELRPGDYVISPTMGAYTTVSATEFNGLAPASVFVATATGRARVLQSVPPAMAR